MTAIAPPLLDDAADLSTLRAKGADHDELFPSFAEWAHAAGTVLYPAQEEALIELVSGANVVLAASNRPLDGEAITVRIQQLGTEWSVVTGERATEWWGDAVSLTDDYAPVDQLLDPYGI